MNDGFRNFIDRARLATERAGLSWNMLVDCSGAVAKSERWNLTKILGSVSTVQVHLSQMGPDRAGLRRLNEIRVSKGLPPREEVAPLPHWQDLIKAAVIHHVVIRNKKAANAVQIAQALRLLAAESGDVQPWAIDAMIVQQAYNASLDPATSGKVALNFKMTIENVLDQHRLCNVPNLTSHCEPFASPKLIQAQRSAEDLRKRENGHHAHVGLRKHLQDRRSPEKLPDRKAFWNLVAIVFTMDPKNFSDHIRFEALKTLIVTGLRVNEAVNLPQDWQRWKEFVDVNGVSASSLGGVGTALRLRHFAEKQAQEVGSSGLNLWEAYQEVPKNFEQLLLQGSEHVSRITASLRERLKLQAKTGRIFPEYDQEDLMPAWEAYVRMTGNARFSSEKIPSEILTAYQRTYDLHLLRQIRQIQLDGTASLRPVYVYFSRLADSGLIVRDYVGRIFSGSKEWRECFFRVAELEDWIRLNHPTKLSDVSVFELSDRKVLHAHEFLYLMPIRNVIEGRNGGILDVEFYYSVGRLRAADLGIILDGSNEGSLFVRYGAKDAGQLKLLTHGNRHLQTTELLKVGVADMAVGKRFNRSGIVPNIVYDHPSLSEDLQSFDPVMQHVSELGFNTQTIYRLIEKKLVVGPIQQQFEKLRREQGDEAAFAFLAAEADGIHVTPYGLCTNSFTSEPCPMHLECYKSCCNLLRTTDPFETESLQTLKSRTETVIEGILAVPEDRRGRGWRNQLAEAQQVLAGVSSSLDTAPGERVFPDGVDLSLPFSSEGQSILDGEFR
jgi:hypothetical protein